MAKRLMCEGCGNVVFTETEVISYDGEGRAWHPHCLEVAESNDPDPDYSGYYSDIA